MSYGDPLASRAKCQPGCTCKRHDSPGRARLSLTDEEREDRKKRARQRTAAWMKENSTNNHRRRAAQFGVRYEYINKKTVFSRCGWMCGLCGLPMDPTVRWPDPRAATLDHIIPIARGGDHVYGNVQGAHYACNLKKGDGQTVIFARKTVIDDAVSATESRNFLDHHHHQGSTGASVRIGLRDPDGSLLALMTFGRPRFTDKAEWELIRWCVKRGHRVTGGASKAFTHFVRHFSPSDVVSYSDNEKFTGRVYSVLKFDLQGESPRGYRWVKGDDSLSRYQCQVHKLHLKYPDMREMTEAQIMTSLGYIKIHNQGNKVWIWRRPVDSPLQPQKR